MDQALIWRDVGRCEEIPRQGARVIDTPSGPIAVFRCLDDRIFALDNRCPHRGGPLSEGIVHGHRVTCPLHNLVIDLPTGSAAGPDEGCAHVVPVRVEGGRISIAIASWRGAGRHG